MITCAPQSPSWRTAVGPARCAVRSMTRKSLSGSGVIGFLQPAGRSLDRDFAPQVWRLQPRPPFRYPLATQRRHLTGHGARQQAHCSGVEPGDRGGNTPSCCAARRAVGPVRRLDGAGAGLAGGSVCRARCFQPAALRSEAARCLARAAVIPRRPPGSRSDAGALRWRRRPLALPLSRTRPRPAQYLR